MQNILVVEDESVLCDVLKINLEIAGFSVDTVCSAEDALKQPDLKKYDLFILDVMLEKMSGFELATKLREDEGLAK